VFFALWPDRAWRERLDALVAASVSSREGRAVAPPDWHITLCFLAAVEEALLPRLQQAAAQLQASAFELHFHSLRLWRPAGVLAAFADCPPAAAALANALRALARDLGLAPDEKPLRPHVTLVRGLRAAQGVSVGAVRIDLPLRADRFHLAQSCEQQQGSALRYRLLGDWPLGHVPG